MFGGKQSTAKSKKKKIHGLEWKTQHKLYMRWQFKNIQETKIESKEERILAMSQKTKCPTTTYKIPQM
jgi:hypothetical protein